MGSEKQKTMWIRNKHPLLGKHHSEKTKRKISEANKIGGIHKGEKNGMFGTHRGGKDNPNWKGGFTIKDGYKIILIGKNKYEYEHRLVWMKENGEIPSGFHIHHINRDKLDNRIKNLQLMTNSKHTILHHNLIKLKNKRVLEKARKEHPSEVAFIELMNGCGTYDI